MAEQYPHSLEQISIADWEATPTSVKRLVSSLLTKNLNKDSIAEISQESCDDKDNRLTQFLDATSVGIAVHNAAGDLIYINHAGRELLTDANSPIPKVGKVEQLPKVFSLYRSTDHQPYPPEELPSCLALAGGKAQIDDLEVHHHDCIIPLEVIAHPMFSSEGQVEYVIATFQDITQRRQTEQALVESRMLYQKVVEAQTDFVLRSLPDSTITFANPSLCRAMGCSLEQLLGTKWINLATPQDLEKGLQQIAQLTPDRSSFLMERQQLRADGSIGWTQWLNQGIFNPQGELVEIQSVGRDITTRKQMELELQQQKELLQLVFDGMPVMAAIASPTGEVLIINQHLETVLGWTQADYDSINVLRESYPNPTDYEATIRHIQSADTNWMESKTRAKDGRIIDTTWTQLRLADGRTISFGLDITKQKCLVTSLAQLNQELEIRIAQRTEALQQQEAMLREAQQVARLGSWELFVATEEVTWSPELFQIFGYDPEQSAPSIAQQSRNFVPEDYQRLTSLVDRAIKFGEPYEVDLQIIREDGSLGYIFAKGQPTLDEDGQLRRLVGIVMDISDRKQAEQEIIHRRDLQEAIFNESTDALFLVNPQTGLTIDCNCRAVEIFEVDHKAELIGIDGCQLHRYPFTPEETLAMVQEVITKGIWSREIEYVTRRENYFWGSIAIKTILVAGIEMCLVRIADISERKQAEQEIIRSRDLREAIFNESTDALFLVDPQTLLTLDCNRRAMELFGVTNKADLIGIAGHSLQRYQFTPDELLSINQELATKGYWSREIEYITQQGDHFWGSLAAKPIMVSDRTMNLVRVTDITSRKQAEARLQQTSQQLETANQELEAFAYSVSHDLRAPLRAIDGFSKALIEDYGDRFDAEAKDYFDRIHRAVERMGDLIDDLLRLSRVSRAEVQSSRVNLTKLVQEIATNLQEFEPERRVEFVIAPEAIVYADNSLIRVVLENLLQNAWKFTSHHPTARIEFGTMPPQIESQLESPTDTVYFIRDDGAGFDMAYATMLFGVFQRLHNTNEFPGTGIGLATVQRIIHRHGGRVWAEGAIEAGATIYFTLSNPI
jgi:PAS domain S-box-containing protein